MDHRYSILGMSLVCAAFLSAHPLQAKDCRISFHVTILHADGSSDELCSVDPWGTSEITAELFPGDSLNIEWEPVDCGGYVMLSVHQGQGSEPATWADPVVLSQSALVNPFAWVPMVPLRFSLPGSFCIRASGSPVDFSAQLYVTVTDQLSTAVSGLAVAAPGMRYDNGEMIMDGTAGGQLLVVNSAGQRVLEQRIAPRAGLVRVPFGGSPGVYLAYFGTAAGSRQSRFVVP